VLIGAQRLGQRRETRKILIVLSDGRPAAHGGAGGFDAHLKSVVKSIQGSGTDVIGIGIQDQSVKAFYPKHVIINRVSELPSVVMTQLKALLIK
jgi:cobaltochelatase CobT